MMCLDSMLQQFGVKKPFKTNGEFTKAGSEAYSKLTSIMYGLDDILGVPWSAINSANCIVEILDQIADGYGIY